MTAEEDGDVTVWATRGTMLRAAAVLVRAGRLDDARFFAGTWPDGAGMGAKVMVDVADPPRTARCFAMMRVGKCPALRRRGLGV